MAKKSILVVEDERVIRESLKLFLEFEGYSAAEASDGREALERLNAAPIPGVILLDLMMPVMDGYDFLKLREHDPELAKIPVVVVSAFVDTHQDLKADGFVGKPVDFDVLMPLVHKFCG